MSTSSEALAAGQAPPLPVTLREAFLYWLKLGFISFGGPAGQISMMHTELVERRRWISEHRFLHALNYTMVLPGPEAQQLATYTALVTFGGAYAVLPYVYQGGVEQYQWLTGTQMIDGLALGETTPGPLIMVVAFVGFVGGWRKEIFGPDSLALAGMAGATVATVFTFLPSFIFILVGGPAVEATRHDVKFTASLTGITAAVVGVVINLAVFFAWHVLWPEATGRPTVCRAFRVVFVADHRCIPGAVAFQGRHHLGDRGQRGGGAAFVITTLKLLSENFHCAGEPPAPAPCNFF